MTSTQPYEPELQKGMHVSTLKDITVHDRNTKATYTISAGQNGVIESIGVVRGGRNHNQKTIVMCFKEGSAVYYGEDMTGFNDNIEIL